MSKCFWCKSDATKNLECDDCWELGARASRSGSLVGEYMDEKIDLLDLGRALEAQKHAHYAAVCMDQLVNKLMRKEFP